MKGSRSFQPALHGFRKSSQQQLRSSTLVKLTTRTICTQPAKLSKISELRTPDLRRSQACASTCKPISQSRHASTTSTELHHTPLHKAHIEAGAKMGPFAGFDMPLEYPDQSHPESHRWTRTNASLFDVSHMVQHKLSGSLAEEFLMTITPAPINTLEKHNSTLSCLLTDEGGIVDDTVITRLGRDSFYFVTNAGCREPDLKYLEENMKTFLESKGKKPSSDDLKWHVLDCHSLVALQGPKAQEVLQKLVYEDKEEDSDGAAPDSDLSTLGFGQSRWLQLTIPDASGGINTPSLLVSRTGYTGEDGFEISIPSENGSSEELANMIAKAFVDDGTTVRWAGLAARDSLRLEAGMCLYGHDIDTKTTPPMAALGWIVGKERRSEDATPAFKGRSQILQQLNSPKAMDRRRVGFVVEKGPAAREGAEIVDPEKDNAVVGKITSGCPAPSLDGQNIAMGYVKNGYHKKGTKLGIKVRKGVRKAEVAKMPFVESKFYRPDLKKKGDEKS